MEEPAEHQDQAAGCSEDLPLVVKEVPPEELIRPPDRVLQPRIFQGLLILCTASGPGGEGAKRVQDGMAKDLVRNLCDQNQLNAL